MNSSSNFKLWQSYPIPSVFCLLIIMKRSIVKALFSKQCSKLVTIYADYFLTTATQLWITIRSQRNIRVLTLISTATTLKIEVIHIHCFWMVTNDSSSKIQSVLFGIATSDRSIRISLLIFYSKVKITKHFLKLAFSSFQIQILPTHINIPFLKYIFHNNPSEYPDGEIWTCLVLVKIITFTAYFIFYVKLKRFFNGSTKKHHVLPPCLGW